MPGQSSSIGASVSQNVISKLERRSVSRMATCQMRSCCGFTVLWPTAKRRWPLSNLHPRNHMLPTTLTTMCVCRHSFCMMRSWWVFCLLCYLYLVMPRQQRHHATIYWWLACHRPHIVRHSSAGTCLGAFAAILPSLLLMSRTDAGES